MKPTAQWLAVFESDKIMKRAYEHAHSSKSVITNISIKPVELKEIFEFHSPLLASLRNSVIIYDLPLLFETSDLEKLVIDYRKSHNSGFPPVEVL